jgi:hypothetical protein
LIFVDFLRAEHGGFGNFFRKIFKKLLTNS